MFKITAAHPTSLIFELCESYHITPFDCAGCLYKVGTKKKLTRDPEKQICDTRDPRIGDIDARWLAFCMLVWIISFCFVS